MTPEGLEGVYTLRKGPRPSSPTGPHSWLLKRLYWLYVDLTPATVFAPMEWSMYFVFNVIILNLAAWLLYRFAAQYIGKLSFGLSLPSVMKVDQNTLESMSVGSFATNAGGHVL